MAQIAGKNRSNMVKKLVVTDHITKARFQPRHTVMILNFRTFRFGQTVQTQIRLLLKEQSDQALHCLLFHLHVFDKIPSGLVSLFEF